MRRALLIAALLVIAVLTACRTSGGFTPRMDGVEVRDELEPLLRAVRAAPDDRAAGEAWSAHLHALGLPTDGVRPESLGKAIRASLPQLESVSAAAPSEAREVASAVGALHGRSVATHVWLVALREDAPLLEQPDRRLLNARAPALADRETRRALLARPMSASLLPSTSGSLGPLAWVVYVQSLSAAAALAVARGAPVSAFTGRSEDDNIKLRDRVPLLARELLASFDSAAPSQVDRFFGASSPDPLLPRGAGAFLSVQLGVALVIDLGSAEKVVRLTPGEFRRAASRALQRMASAP